MAKNNNKISEKNLYMIGIAIILVLIVISAIISASKKQEEKIDQTIDQVEVVDEENGKVINKNIIATLQGMNERERMEYYFGEFLQYVEDQEYDKAYDLLYKDFKSNYFPTLGDFESYISTIFSEMTNISYENIERNGEVYVLWIKITDALNGKPGEEREMNIVLKENDYDDFELSFSII